MNQIRNSKSVHTMNRHVSQLAAHVATVCDIDCIYRNHVQEFWCMFEWKKDSERMQKEQLAAKFGDDEFEDDFID